MTESTKMLRICFLVALMAMLGSLFFSDVLGYPPCILCWYQRIAMYPLVLIFGTALWRGDQSGFRYAAPLIVIGLLIAAYHNLLYYEFIPDSITPCKQGISCTSKQVEILGFLTIPLMSFLSFIVLAALSVLGMRASEEQK